MLLSNIGTWMQNLALPAYIDDRTGSAKIVSLLVFAQLGPLLLLAIPGGIIAGRYNLQRYLLAMQWVQLVFSLVLAAIVSVDGPIWALFLAQTAIGVGNALNAPAFQASVPMLVDRRDLAGAKSLAKILHTTGLSTPLIIIVTEGGLAAINSEWKATDIILENAGPAEIDARIRLALSRKETSTNSEKIHASGVVIDEASYSAKVSGRTLDLTFKEFELLRYFVQHKGKVVTREQILNEVWGYEEFPTTRTIDNFVAKLRQKIEKAPHAPEHILTIHGSGYKFVG